MLGEKTSSAVLGKLSHGFWPWRDTLVRLFAERLLPPSRRGHFLSPKTFSAVGYCLLTIAAVALQTSCTSTRYDGFSRITFGTKVNIPELRVEVSTNGSKKIFMKGYSNDGMEALGIVAEKAAKGAVEGMKNQ